MLFKLNAREDGTSINYSPKIPQAMSAFTIPASDGLYASGSFGSGIIYLLELPGFNIGYYHYIIKKTSVLLSNDDSPVIALHFSLHNNILYNLQGLGETRLPERHFNMTYVPYVKNKMILKEGTHYSMMDICFSPGYLERFSNEFPLLQQLLKRETRGAAGMLTGTPTAMTTRMDDDVMDLLRCDFTGDMRTIFLQNRVTDLLLEVLRRLGKEKKATGSNLTLKDMEKVRHARDYILFHVDKPCSLADLALKVELNEFKLKNGFKQLFGSTIFDFVVDARMNKARMLLVETGMSVYEVALATGYKNVPAFSTAFRKKTGYSPGSLKKRNKQ